MSDFIPWSATAKRIPDPGGSQGSPEVGPRRVVMATWFPAYLCVVTAACLSTVIGPKAFAVAWGAPPVVLFISLSILGMLTRGWQWGWAILWAVLCGAAIYLSLEAIFHGDDPDRRPLDDFWFSELSSGVRKALALILRTS